MSGRILEGLQCLNAVKYDVSEVWIFESGHEKRSSFTDTTIFWRVCILLLDFGMSLFLVINWIKVFMFLCLFNRFYFNFSNYFWIL